MDGARDAFQRRDDPAAGRTGVGRNADTPVEAAEIRHGNGVFWGVQYHPEITLAEVAASLRRQASDLIDAGLAASI